MSQNDLAAALKSYRVGLAVAERLTQTDPSDAGWQRDRSELYILIVVVYLKMGEIANALDALHRCRAILIRLSRLAPDSAVWKKYLAWVEETIARIKQIQ